MHSSEKKSPKENTKNALKHLHPLKHPELHHEGGADDHTEAAQKISSREMRAEEGKDEDSDFVEKYGPVKFKWIDPPESAKKRYMIIKPYALNYYHNGVLYRTRGERGSSVFELFFDLLYVGIIANLAESCIEHSDGKSLAKYVLLFFPCWQIWGDMRCFMDYYYNNDIIQKTYVVWIMSLLVTYANNAQTTDENDKQLFGLVVACYMLARFSFATIVLLYNLLYIKEHRRQMVGYCIFVYCSVIMAGFVILPKAMYKKIIILCCLYFWDIVSYAISFSPWFKRFIRSEFHTALNIEHEIKRHSAFVTIALGEFLYVIVAHSPATSGLNERTARAICSLIIAYCLSWFYFMGEGSKKAVHAIRRHAMFSVCWIQLHFPLIISLVIAADAAGELTRSGYDFPMNHAETVVKRATSEGPSLELPRDNYIRDVEIFFGAGIFVALVAMTGIALLDKGLDKEVLWKFTPKVRILPRIMFGGIIFGMAFSDMKITLFLGLSALFLTIQLLFENVEEVDGSFVHEDTDVVKNVINNYDVFDSTEDEQPAQYNSSEEKSHDYEHKETDEDPEIEQEQQGSIESDFASDGGSNASLKQHLQENAAK
ncbi:hypothetical protein ACO0RG_002974 [Hanseniaspora osmophila]|uniref:Uncharacterized protein n=1 Tax=Hanseniaspora osmophila TaxID=56408 RepID=A0A1E5RYZ1_9ASCO|nr:hypothetical protein AWRI3579_g246 [Hanseniaspora osmophila]